ncbi:MAG: hypothetical protein WC022_02450 [Parcubacteria group bacterium]
MDNSIEEIKKLIREFEKDILGSRKNDTAAVSAILELRFGGSFARRKLVSLGELTLEHLVQHLSENMPVDNDLQYAWCKLFNWIEMDVDLEKRGPEEYILDEWIGWAKIIVGEEASYKKLPN